jgi:hypothetical protein
MPINLPMIADPKKPRLSLRRMCTRDYSQLSCELAAGLELGHVTEGRDERGGPREPDPGRRLQPPASGWACPTAASFSSPYAHRFSRARHAS